MHSAIINLRIHGKLLLLPGTFLVPIFLLAWLFIDQSYKDIGFATKELQGTHYLTPLRTMLMPLATGDAAGSAQAIADVERIDKEADAAMNLGDAGAKAVAAVRNASMSNAAAPNSGNTAPVRQARDAVRELIAAIGDGSNLILDPELDSFYTMDLAVVKMPLMVEQTAAVLDAARDAFGHDKPSFSELAQLQLHLGELTGTLSGIEGSLKSAVKGSPDGSLGQSLVGPYSALKEAFKAYVDSLEGTVKSGNARIAIGDVEKLEAVALNQTAMSWERSTHELERLLAARIAGFKAKLYWCLGAVGLVLIIAGAMSREISLSIRGPMVELARVMRLMAEGDLTVEVPLRGRHDEVGVLAEAAADMREHLHALASDVRAHTQAVHVASGEITANVEGQVAMSSEMSASVAEITSTMEELSASSTQISEHSYSVVDIANVTYQNSKKGSEAMQLVLSKMGDIETDNQNSLREILELGSRSKEITKVMEIINQVADHTKLIAFNAALEAASAGEAGRRFGVVAAEIRRLADSVTESTGEIEAKIGQIQDSISRLVVTSEKGATGIAAGMSATQHTTDRLTELVEAAHQTTNAAQQIALSTQQQQTASSQVVVALRDIVTASNNTAHSTGRILEISKDMGRLSAGLDTVAQRFRLSDNA